MLRFGSLGEGKGASHQIWVRREKLIPLDIPCCLYLVALTFFPLLFSLLPDHIRLAISALASSALRSTFLGNRDCALALLSDRDSTGSSRPYDAARKWRRRRDLLLQINVTIDK